MKVIIVLNVFKLIIENKRTYPYYMSYLWIFIYRLFC
jgi:hypothetical protein